MIHINKKYILTLGLGLSFLFSSCVKDLDRFPTSGYSADNIYSDASKTKQALAKVYGSYGLTGQKGDFPDVAGADGGSTGFLREFYNLQELPTEEAVCAWSDGSISDLNTIQWTSSNEFIGILYYRSIFQIKVATAFLKQTEGLKGNKDVKAYRAEARFLRAFQYWVLMDLFGNPPIINESLATGKNAPNQFKRAELYAWIEKELLAIEGDLLAPKTNEYGRVDRAGLWALLARMYLNAEVYTGQEQYAKASEYAEKVIATGQYSLGTNYANLFLADNHLNNPEAILTINYNGIQGQTYSGTTFLVNASQNDYSKAFITKEKPDVKLSTQGWGGNRATLAFDQLFDKKDSRYLMAGEKKEIKEVSDFTQGVWVYKFRNVTSTGKLGSDNTYADNDFPLFRLAEMYMIYAEASARGKADKAKGLQYLNKLRERAFGDNSKNFTELKLEDILAERGREFYWEGFRRSDLIRFGKFTSGDYLWAWKGGLKGGQAVDEHYKLYPIPASDILANPKLKQNPKY